MGLKGKREGKLGRNRMGFRSKNSAVRDQVVIATLNGQQTYEL